MTIGRLLLLLVPSALPGGPKRACCRRVRVGLSFIDAAAVDLGDDVRIGHFNVVRGVAELTVGGHTYGANRATFPTPVRSGRHVKWMTHHPADADDGGRSLDPQKVTIGPDAYICARATPVGCGMPAGASVGAGGVATKRFPPDPDGRPLLIGGNPAAVRTTCPAPAKPTPAELSIHE